MDGISVVTTESAGNVDGISVATTESAGNVDGSSVVTTESAGNVDGTANVLGIGREAGTENDGVRRASFEFSTRASRALSLLLENIEMVALKEPTTVAFQVQRFQMARAEKVSPELAQVAQEFLATEH